MQKDEFKPDYRVHPSQIVKEMISFKFAEQNKTNKDGDWWFDFIEGEIEITNEIAEELGKIFEIDKQFFLNLQKNYMEKYK